MIILGFKMVFINMKDKKLKVMDSQELFGEMGHINLDLEIGSDWNKSGIKKYFSN